MHVTFGPHGLQRTGDGDWQPAVWSTSRGLRKDPIHRDTLGPKGHVPEEFLDFGPVPAGRAAWFRTRVTVPGTPEAWLVVGAAAAKEVWVDGVELPLDDSGYLAVCPTPLAPGEHLLELRLTPDEDLLTLRAHVSLTADPEAARRPEWITGPDMETVVEAEEGTAPGRLHRDLPGAGERHRGRAAGRVRPVRGGGHPARTPLQRVAPAASRTPTRSGWSRRGPCSSTAWWSPVPAGRAVLPYGGASTATPPRSTSVPDRTRSPRPDGSTRAPPLCPRPSRCRTRRSGSNGSSWTFRRARPDGGRRARLCPGPRRWRGIRSPAVLDGSARRAELQVTTRPGFQSGAALAGPVRFACGPGRIRLGDWESQGLAGYSGGVRYRTTLRHAGRARLDLGRVRGTAEVIVNGRSAGVRVCWPYTFDLNLDAQESTIEILVLGTLAPYLDAVSPTHFVFPGQRVTGLFGPVTLRTEDAASPARTRSPEPWRRQTAWPRPRREGECSPAGFSLDKTYGGLVQRSRRCRTRTFGDGWAMTTMSATRLLLLGVVRTHGQANGYLVNAELESWGAEKWAGLKPGSIYQSLRQLAREGLLDAGEVHEWPETHRLQDHREGSGRVPAPSPQRPQPSGPPSGDAGSGSGAAARAAEKRGDRPAQGEAPRDGGGAYGDLDRAAERGEPSHIRELLGMRAWSTASGADWARGLIARLENGDHIMADEGDRPAGTVLIPEP